MKLCVLFSYFMLLFYWKGGRGQARSHFQTFFIPLQSMIIWKVFYKIEKGKYWKLFSEAKHTNCTAVKEITSRDRMSTRSATGFHLWKKTWHRSRNWVLSSPTLWGLDYSWTLHSVHLHLQLNWRGVCSYNHSSFIPVSLRFITGKFHCLPCEAGIRFLNSQALWPHILKVLKNSLKEKEVRSLGT